MRSINPEETPIVRITDESLIIHRLSRCLLDLHRPDEAEKVVNDFRNKFPDYASNAALRALAKDIVAAIKASE